MTIDDADTFRDAVHGLFEDLAGLETDEDIHRFWESEPAREAVLALADEMLEIMEAGRLGVPHSIRRCIGDARDHDRPGALIRYLVRVWRASKRHPGDASAWTSRRIPWWELNGLGGILGRLPSSAASDEMLESWWLAQRSSVQRDVARAIGAVRMLCEFATASLCEPDSSKAPIPALRFAIGVRESAMRDAEEVAS